ncbi:MAG: sulfatase [Gemmataceae bacterium]
MLQASDRRNFLATSGLTAGGLLMADMLPALADSDNNENRRPPNVVLIISDDQRWTDFGFMDHPVIKTPRLDRLASESAVFPNGYVPCSLCRASLATILTGLWASQHQICCNDPPRGVDRARMHPFIRNAPALPRLLRAANYRSLQTGKFWEGHFQNAGFTSGQTTNTDRHIARRTPQIGRRTMQPIYDFIDANRTNPFMVWYAPMMPHKPHNPPPEYLRCYNRGRDINIAKYYAMCQWFDETCGQLLDHIERRELTNNTLVLFVVDNGWVQPTRQQQRALRSPFGGARGKRSPYDGGVRTPLMIKWPGHTRAGRYNDLVSTVDIAPTVLRACGREVPNKMYGKSLLDVAAGRGRLNRNAVFGEIYEHDCGELGRPRMDITFRWIRKGDWKLIVPAQGNNIELFNLARDPHERTNLAAQNEDKVRELRQDLEQWWTRLGRENQNRERGTGNREQGTGNNE